MDNTVYVLLSVQLVLPGDSSDAANVGGGLVSVVQPDCCVLACTRCHLTLVLLVSAVCLLSCVTWPVRATPSKDCTH